MKYLQHFWHSIAWNVFFFLYIYVKSCILSCKCHVCGNNFKIKFLFRKHFQKNHFIFFGFRFEISTFQTYFTKWKTSTNEKKKAIVHSSLEIFSFTALRFCLAPKSWLFQTGNPKIKKKINLLFLQYKTFFFYCQEKLSKRNCHMGYMSHLIGLLLMVC